MCIRDSDFTDDGGSEYDALIISDYDKGFITQEQLFILPEKRLIIQQKLQQEVS